MCTYALIYEADILIYLALLWQYCFSVQSIVQIQAFVFEFLCCCDGLSCRQENLNTPFFSCPLLCEWFSRLPTPPSLLSDGLKHFTQTVGHSPCAKGKHSLKVECRPVTLCHTSRGEVSAGHSQKRLSRLSTVCSLPLKNLLLTYVIPLAVNLRPWFKI